MSFKIKVPRGAASLAAVGGVVAAAPSNTLAAVAALIIVSGAAIFLVATSTACRVGPLLATVGCQGGLLTAHPALRRVSVATGRLTYSGGMRR